MVRERVVRHSVELGASADWKMSCANCGAETQRRRHVAWISDAVS